MKWTKYGNRRTYVGTIPFDSRHEADRYLELQMLQRAGQISDLQLQVPFELIPVQKRDGKVVERALKYIADFVYTEKGETVVEDAKGMKTREYVIKRKLMLWEFGIRVREV